MSSGNGQQDAIDEILANAEEIEAPPDPAHFRVLLRIATNPKNHLAVSLGGGAMVGLAGNCALIALLTELGIRPHVKEVWGTSAGSVVGGGWCTGAMAEDILPIIQGLDRRGVVDIPFWEVLCKGAFRLLAFKKLPQGLIRARHFRDAIASGLQAETFDECEIPFRVIVCTDDGKGRKVILREGPLLEAIMASMALPGVMFPVDDPIGRSDRYVDGGVVEKTPLVSIVEEHTRRGRESQLVVIASHFVDSDESRRPDNFLERFISTFSILEDQVWEYQLDMARQSANCKFFILNPQTRFGGTFDFSLIRANYLLARKLFKSQLSNANIGIRFDAR